MAKPKNGAVFKASQRKKLSQKSSSRTETARLWWDKVKFWGSLLLVCASALVGFLGFGYCREIGHVPINSIGSLISMAVLMALVALLFSAGFLVFLAIPSMWIGYVRAATPTAWSAIQAPFLKRVDEQEHSAPRVWLQLSAWIFLSLLSVQCFSWNPNPLSTTKSPFVIGVLVLLGCLIFGYVNGKGAAQNKPQELWPRLVFSIGLCIFSSALWLGTIELWRRSPFAHSWSDHDLFWGVLGTLFLVSLSSTLYMQVVVQWDERRIKREGHFFYVICLFLVFALLCTLLRIPVFTNLLIATSIRIPHVDIGLNAKACASLSLEGTAVRYGQASTPTVCKLENVLVLSSIGDTLRIACRAEDFDPQNERKNKPAFSIPAKSKTGIFNVEMLSPEHRYFANNRNICPP